MKNKEIQMKFKNAIEIHLDNVILLGNKREFKLQGYDNKFLQSCFSNIGNKW